MLSVSPVRKATSDESNTGGDGGRGDVGASAAVAATAMVEEEDIIQTCEFTINPEDEFPEFADSGNLLESIDFDDLFCEMDGGDSLPDLEIDPEILSGDFSDRMNASSTVTTERAEKGNLGKGEEVASKGEDNDNTAAKKRGVEKKRKYSSKNNKNNSNQGKRKVKVDWTPELHRRFVQAVEQLGVDKAVPSRILELMGIDCLTRHNVASHLQKYRSHRKHLLAREAEAASWTHQRQMYGAKSRWLAPTVGFPPPVPAVTPPLHHHHRHFRPLHVWGHPKVDQAAMPHMWPKHPLSPPPPQSSVMAHPPFWGLLPPPDATFWQRVPNAPTPGTPCYPQPPVAPTRFGASLVPGIPRQSLPHHSIYRADSGVGIPTGQSGPPPSVEFHPTKESIDAAIGDVLTKPWLPLPLGLKPPSTDSVMVELHRHGVSDVPPTPSCA